MSNHDDFWTTLATGHTNTVLAGSMDTHLSGKSIEESFGSVRTLTDTHRAANALALPVAAGTKVAFAGNIGAYMSYDDVPADGIIGEVVTVRSATGEITHHDGKVFVKWADGKFRPIHAEHLRLVTSGKTAMEHASPEALKQYLKEHPKADKAKHTVSKGNGEGSGGEKDKAAPPHHAKVDKDLKTLASGWEKIDPKKAEGDMRKAWGTFNEAVDRFDERADLAVKAVADTITRMFDKIGDAGAPRKSGEHLANMVKGLHSMAVIEGKGDAAKGYEKMGLGAGYDPFKGREKTDADHSAQSQHSRGRQASDLKAQFEKIKALAEKRPDSKFLKSVLKQMADKGFAPTDKQMAVVKKIEGEIKQQGEMKKELKGLDKKGEFNADDIGKKQNGPLTHDPEDKKIMDHFGQGDLHEMTEVANDKTATFRVASLGDLTDFLKVSSGALVHKSTKDLWSYSKDADGNFLVSRLFDDEGEPLKV